MGWPGLLSAKFQQALSPAMEEVKRAVSIVAESVAQRLQPSPQTSQTIFPTQHIREPDSFSSITPPPATISSSLAEKPIPPHSIKNTDTGWATHPERVLQDLIGPATVLAEMVTTAHPKDRGTWVEMLGGLTPEGSKEKRTASLAL